MPYIKTTTLAFCAVIVSALPTLSATSADASERKDPIVRPPLTDVSTQEIAKALAFRGVTVPGHADPAAPWPDVKQFQIKVTYSIRNANVYATNVFCDLTTRCTFEIPSPRDGDAPVSFSFVHREQLRNELIADKLPPIGLDSLRGDAVGLVYNGANKELPVNPVKDSLLGYWVSTYSSYQNQPNPKVRLVPAALRKGNRAWRWAISYTHLREHGLVLNSPHGTGGVARISVIDGDPAPGVQDYTLPLNSTTQLIEALKDRGIKVSTAPHKGRMVYPSRFIAALEIEHEITVKKTGRVLRSDPKDKERAIICDLTRGQCVVRYRLAFPGRSLTLYFKHPLSLLPLDASLPPPDVVGLDLRVKSKTTWDGFFKKFKGVKSAGAVDKNDPLSPHFVSMGDLMTDGIGNQSFHAEIQNYKDLKWFLRLRVLRLIN